MYKFLAKDIARKGLIISLCILIVINISLIIPMYPSSVTIGNNVFKNLTGPYAKFVDNTYVTEMDGWHAATNLNASSGDRFVQPISNATKLWIDIGAIYSISKLSLNWDPSNFATKYNVLISIDNTTWTNIATVERSTPGTAVTNFPTIPDCRYMVIDVISVIGSSWAIVNNSTGELNALYGVLSENPTNVSVNKPADLVDLEGKTIDDSEILSKASKITDGDADNFAQTKNTKFGAIVNLQGLAKITDISVTSYKNNSVSKFDIKISKDGFYWETIQTNISLLAGQRKLINIGQKYIGRFIWIAPSTFIGTSLFAIGEITINGQMLSSDINVALNKIALAYEHLTTNQISAFTGEIAKAIDGSADSYNPNANFAQASSAAQDWDFVIDYSNIVSISVLNYTPENDNYIESFDVYTSFDGIDWTIFKSGLIYTNDVAGQNGSGKTAQYTFAYPAVGRFIKISPTKIKISGNNSHCITEIETIGYNPTGIIPLSTKMISLENGGTPVSTLSQYTPDKAFDGDNTTYAQSQSFTPWDMVVTLPDNYEIMGIYLRCNSTGKIHIPLDYSIETSNNGFGFLPIKTVTGNTKTTQGYTFNANVVAKYLRLNVTKTSLITGNSGYNIAEFQIYGRPKTPIYLPATDINISSDQTLSLLSGDVSQIVIDSIAPLDASSDITYSSENTSVATVSKNGTITATGGGATNVHVVSGTADKTIQVKVLGNVALNKSASMSASSGWGNIPAYAIDDNKGSICQADVDSLWTLTIDLLDFYSVSVITIDQSDACYATSFSIEASLNGFFWYSVVNETNFTVNMHGIYKFAPRNAKFIRFVPTAKQTNGASIAIKEIGVFGEKINAENQTVNEITLDYQELYLIPRNEFQMTGKIDPVETMVSWTSSDESIAKVSGAGKITAIKSGVATITARGGDKSDTCKVYVKRDLAKNTYAEMVGASPGWGNIAAFAIDGNKDTAAQSNKDVPWDLIVDLGVAQPINNIYYRPDGYNYASLFSIKVSTDKENWTTITNENVAGDGAPKVFDFVSINARYVWLDAVSTVVKLPAGVTDSSLLDYGAAINDFEVYGDFVAITDAQIAKASADIPIGFIYLAKVNYYPTNATIKSSSWKSSDANIATVDSDGNIKGLNTGTARITATTYDKEIILTMDVRVYETENIALYKKNVWMDADVGFGNDASNAVDGSYQTVAQSMLNVPWSLFVQFPVKAEISSFRVTMNDFNFANHYKILISDNYNGPWQLVYENFNASPKTLTVFLDNKVETEFVKFEAVSTIGDFGYALHEFEISTAYGFDNNKIPKPNFDDSGPEVWDGPAIEPNNNIVYSIIQTFKKRIISAHSSIGAVNTNELLMRLKNLLFENGELTIPISETPENPYYSDTTSSEISDNSSMSESSSTIENSSGSSSSASGLNNISPTPKPTQKPNSKDEGASKFIFIIVTCLILVNILILIFSFVLPKIISKKGMEKKS